MERDDRRWGKIAFFRPHEIECNCGCRSANIKFEIMSLADSVRTAYTNLCLNTNVGNKSLTVTSGCRCPEHNYNEDGAWQSYHLTIPGRLDGHAIDLAPTELNIQTMSFLRKAAESVNPPGLKLVYPGKNFIHMDVRPLSKGQWRG